MSEHLRSALNHPCVAFYPKLELLARVPKGRSGDDNRRSSAPMSKAFLPVCWACTQKIADSEPAEQSSRSHSVANNSLRIPGQWVRFGSLTGGQARAVTTDQVTSAPPVARTNSGSISRAAKASACPLTMASRFPASSVHQSLPVHNSLRNDSRATRFRKW